MSSLLEIAQSLALIEQKILESGGEITPEIESLYSQIELTKKDKIDSYAEIIDRCEMLAEFYGQKESQLAKVRKSFESLKDHLHFNLKQAMYVGNFPEAEGNEYKFKLSYGKDKLVIEQDKLLPKYIINKIVMEPNKELIRSDLEAGKEVVGARLEKSPALRKTLLRKKV